MYYQAKPSLRVQVPGAKGIRFHRDVEYMHQTGEVNWWLPITPTYGSNTLMLESAPDADDFQPLVLLPSPPPLLLPPPPPPPSCRPKKELPWLFVVAPALPPRGRRWRRLPREPSREAPGRSRASGQPVPARCETTRARVSLDPRRRGCFEFDAAVGRKRRNGSQRFFLGGYYRCSDLAKNPRPKRKRKEARSVHRSRRWRREQSHRARFAGVEPVPRQRLLQA